MQSVRRTYGRRRDITPQVSDNEDLTPPTSQHSCSHGLTPKAKIAAMLAQLDESDDEEIASPEISTSRHPPAIDRYSGDSRLDVQHKRDGHVPTMPISSGPLPSVSQIMQAEADGSEDDSQDEGSAYERLRRNLLATTAQSPETIRPVVLKQSITSTDSSAEDFDIELPSTSAALTQALAVAAAGRKLQQPSHPEQPRSELDPSRLEISIDGHAQTSGSGSDSEDIEAEIRMSSSKRAPRRASSKKAIEEMHKETERIQRSMTLAPDAQVKTKLKVNDFLSKIGYLKQPKLTAPVIGAPPVEIPTDNNDPFTESIIEEAQQDNESCNLMPVSDQFAVELEESDEDIELPGLADLISSQHQESRYDCPSPPKMRLDIHQDILLDSDSDNELDLPSRLKSHKLLFKRRDFNQIKRDRKAAKFVAMARPDSPTKLEARQEKARKAALMAQVSKKAKADRQAREAALKAAGITIMSSEQRQREALEVEDLVEKARRQATELRRLEAKEDKMKQAAEDGVNEDSSDEDNDWQHVEEDASDSDLDTSNDESDSDSEKSSAENVQHDSTNLVKPQLGRTASILSERRLSDDEEHMSSARRPILRKLKRNRILGDDSDEDKENSQPIQLEIESAEFGLTQFFSPSQEQTEVGPAREFSATQFFMSPGQGVGSDMQILRNIDNDETDDRIGGLGTALVSLLHEVPQVVPSSQPEDPAANMIGTQFSIFDPPSPDNPVRPLSPRIHAQFTQGTEVDISQRRESLHDVQQTDTIVPRPSRLRKASLSDLASATVKGDSSVNAFKKMRQTLNDEEQRRSRKALVDDRAVESDDEYAGLGGVSEEEPEDVANLAAELAEMIDHDVADADEEGQRQIAAFYAKKDLENDEKLVNTLMNDINNGGLRRKRGAGLLDMEDSEDEEEETARYKARQAQMRARLLESQNLTSLVDNPKARAFIEALEDRPKSSNYIDIAGEDDTMAERVPETQLDPDVLPADVQIGLTRSETLVDDEELHSHAKFRMNPPASSFRKPKRKTQSDIRNELSFLQDDDDHSQQSEALDPGFVPALKRERSSLSIENRTHLSRENSQTWRDPRQNLQKEDSMYSQLASARSTESLHAAAPVTVVVSKGHQMASRMATKAVNYHAKAAQAMREGRQKLANNRDSGRVKRKGGKEVTNGNKKQDVLKLLA